MVWISLSSIWVSHGAPRQARNLVSPRPDEGKWQRLVIEKWDAETAATGMISFGPMGSSFVSSMWKSGLMGVQKAPGKDRLSDSRLDQKGRCCTLKDLENFENQHKPAISDMVTDGLIFQLGFRTAASEFPMAQGIQGMSWSLRPKRRQRCCPYTWWLYQCRFMWPGCDCKRHVSFL